MGHSFSLWANVSSALCVPLHLAFISVSCSRSLFFFFSHVAPLSSVDPNVCVLVTVTCSVSDYPVAGPLPSSRPVSLCWLSVNSPHSGRVCLCVGCVQTSCGLGWISSPARLLLEIHPGFSSQSKSGRPRLSQHTTGPSVSTNSSSSSAAQRETQRVFGLYSILKKTRTDSGKAHSAICGDAA